jgi:hypothetical protein
MQYTFVLPALMALLGGSNIATALQLDIDSPGKLAHHTRVFLLTSALQSPSKMSPPPWLST